MDIFEIHRRVVDEYRTYIDSFIDIRDERVRAVVEKRLRGGELWPSPLVQFNPAYEVSERLSALYDTGLLHPEVRDVFPFDLYRHQVEALQLGVNDRDFVVTSGTGSGKSLTYLGTIFNDVFLRPTNGVRAIIIYPMNALINSQTEEINKHKDRYESRTGRPFPIRFAQYTGQEGREARDRIVENQPHVVLTNYMMMELIMSRQRRQDLWLREQVRKHLKYLVFDELHTYRGRQGADVALLNRRIRALAEQDIVCIGTSATMASGPGTLAKQRQQVAVVAGRMFGKPFAADQVIDEKLAQQLRDTATNHARLVEAVRCPIDPETLETKLVEHPLAVWLEHDVGLEEKEGQLIRRKPLALPEITERLATQTGLEIGVCEHALRAMLTWIERVNARRAAREEKPLLPFKLHQFIAQTGSVYVTLEDRQTRQITLEAGYYLGGEDEEKLIFPTVFSRLSGHDFICVQRDDFAGKLYPRDFFDLDRPAEDDEGGRSGGYLILDFDDESVWTDEYLAFLPDSWLNVRKDGSISLKGAKEGKIPQRIYFDADGSFSDSPGDHAFSGWYMEAPIAFDPTSGTFYDARTRDFTKLSKLGSEARSTATTVLARTVVRQLGMADVDREAQKVLSFTDNRQDASLQAGHFNDFARVIQLRSAIYHALEVARNETLEVEDLAQAVFAQMGLPETEYAKDPLPGGGRFRVGTNENEEALKLLVFYRALYDLRRSWRIVLPNLEQCGLLRIRYKYLGEIVQQDAGWRDVRGFEAMTPARRAEVFRQILDYFRRSYALDHVRLERGRARAERARHPKQVETAVGSG